MRALLIILILLPLGSCGANNEHTGVWQQATCNGVEGQPCGEDGFLYELHLGRYGDAVTGVLVRYRFIEGGINNFDPTTECGCFIIGFGDANGDRLRFQLYGHDAPGLPDPDYKVPADCAPLPGECRGRIFDLDGSDPDRLVGTVGCGSADDTVEIEFETTDLTPRRECSLPE